MFGSCKLVLGGAKGMSKTELMILLIQTHQLHNLTVGGHHQVRESPRSSGRTSPGTEALSCCARPTHHCDRGCGVSRYAEIRLWTSEPLLQLGERK